MQLIGTLKEPPSRADAEAFFERYVATAPARLEWFTEQILALTGEAPRSSLDDLPRLATCVTDVAGEERDVDPPEWYQPELAQAGWSPFGAAMADGLFYLLAEIYRSELGASWVLNTDRGHLYFHQPVMSVRLAVPPWVRIATLEMVRRGMESPNRLAEVMSVAIEAAREELHQGDQPADPIRVSVDPLLGHPEFTHQIWIDEDAESRLGQDLFNGLWKRFESIPGVEKVIHEDREIFLARASGLSSHQLEQRANAIVDGLMGLSPK